MKNEKRNTEQVKYDLPVKGSAEPTNEPDRTYYKLNKELYESQLLNIRRKELGS